MEHQNARQQHGQGHRDAEGGGEIVGGAEGDGEQKSQGHQRPIDEADIDLAIAQRRGLGDADARQQADLDRLAGHGIGAGDDRLAGDHRGGGGQQDQRQLQRLRAEFVKRIGVGAHGAVDEQRGLAGIGQKQRRKHQSEPGEADWFGAEMAHVGVKRLGAGGAEENRAKHQEAGHAMAEQIMQADPGIEGDEHMGVARDAHEAEHAYGDEPHRHDRPEQPGYLSGAHGLQAEQPDQHNQRHLHHIGGDRGGRGLQALQRGEHGDRRGDGAVAEQERRAEHAHGDDQRLAPMLDAEQRHQRQNAAFAVIVGAHDYRDIFDRGDDGQRPQDQREHAQRLAGVELAAGPVDGGLDGVERAGANVPIDDAERAQRQHAEALGMGVLRGVARVFGGHGGILRGRRRKILGRFPARLKAGRHAQDKIGP